MKKTLALMFAVAFLFSLSAGAGQQQKKKVTPPTVKEKVTFKKFNQNDPKTNKDNTITFIKDGKEVERPIHESWNEQHLKMFKDQDVNLTSNIIPQTGDYIVTDVLPFAY